MATKRTPRRAVTSRPSIRDATLSDAKGIASLITALGYPTNATDMKRRLEVLLADPSYTTFVAVEGDEIVGMAGACIARFYEKNGIYARLVALVVSEASSGKGLGGTLVRAVERWGKERGAVEILLNSGVQRESTRPFYEKLGYRVTGVRFSKELE